MCMNPHINLPATIKAMEKYKYVQPEEIRAQSAVYAQGSYHHIFAPGLLLMKPQKATEMILGITAPSDAEAEQPVVATWRVLQTAGGRFLMRFSLSEDSNSVTAATVRSSSSFFNTFFLNQPESSHMVLSI